MNNKYFETNDNNYVVIENNKDISLVKSNNDIEEILNLENDLEIFQKDIENYNKEIEIAKTNLFLKKKFNKFLLYAELFYVVIALLFKIAPIDLILPTIIVSSVSLELLVTNLLGTKEKNKKKLKRYNLRKVVALSNVESINLKLEKAKKISDYKKESVISLINDNYEIENNNLENNKVKRLILIKPNEN